MQVTFTVEHLNPAKPTIYTALRDKLGREPTNAELRDDVRRILRSASDESLVARTAQGRLHWQRRK